MFEDVDKLIKSFEIEEKNSEKTAKNDEKTNSYIEGNEFKMSKISHKCDILDEKTNSYIEGNDSKNEPKITKNDEKIKKNTSSLVYNEKNDTSLINKGANSYIERNENNSYIERNENTSLINKGEIVPQHITNSSIYLYLENLIVSKYITTITNSILGKSKIKSLSFVNYNDFIQYMIHSFNLFSKLGKNKLTYKILNYIEKNKFSYLSDISNNLHENKGHVNVVIQNLIKNDILKIVDESSPEIRSFIRMNKSRGPNNYVFYELSNIVKDNLILIEIMSLNVLDIEEYSKIKSVKRKDPTAPPGHKILRKKAMIGNTKYDLLNEIYINPETGKQENTGWFIPTGLITCDGCGHKINFSGNPKKKACIHYDNHVKYCDKCYFEKYPKPEDRIKFVENTGNVIQVLYYEGC